MPESIVVTGASGQIGARYVSDLVARGIPVVAVDLTPSRTVSPLVLPLECSILDTDTLATAMAGAAGVVHLGGISGESDWPLILASNIDGTRSVLEAARRSGRPPIVLASSAHVAGYARPADLADDPALVRPDTYYGVSKAASEALGSLFADRYSMTITSLRIGTCEERPRHPRSLSTWLAPDDFFQLADVALRRSEPGHLVWWAASANSRGWFPMSEPMKFGYSPHGNAEDWAADVGPADSGTEFKDRVGGAWATPFEGGQSSRT